MKKIYFWLMLVILLAGGGYATYKATRGYRNKNPGNIRFNPANDWNGQAGKDAEGFVVFSDSKYGIRAIGKVFDSYQRRGLYTIAQMISTYAPSNENDTESYIKSVVRQMKLPGRDYIPYRASGEWVELVKAIIHHENGINIYTDKEIKEALSL